MPDDVEVAFRAAVDALRQGHDAFLLEVNASERSIAHRLAVELERRIVGFDIDCEYNRTATDGKSITSFELRRLSDEARRIRSNGNPNVSVYPDILVHHRGTEDNLLAVEIKKHSSGAAAAALVEFDRAKLNLYQALDGLAYEYTAMVTFFTGPGHRALGPEIEFTPNPRTIWLVPPSVGNQSE